MTPDELLLQIKATLGKSKVTELSNILYTANFSIPDLIKLSFYPQKNIAFRAAWILENLVLKQPMRIIDDLDLLLNSFLTTKNHSCQRHYIKIIMHLMDK